MIESLVAWFLARMIPIGIGLGVLASVFVWDHVRISKAETRGAEKLAAKVERKDNAAAETIRKAGDLSVSAEPGRLRGVVRDPHSVSE